MGSYSEYLGRLGIIVDEVKVLLNDRSTTSWHNSLDIVGYVNRGLRELAGEGYWNDETTLTVTPGVDSIDLLTSIPGLVRVNAVRPSDSTKYLHCYTNWPQLDGSRNRYGYLSTDTYGYFIDGRTLRLVNAPSTDAGDLTVYYSYKPDTLGKIIQCNSAAVVNKGGGLVGLPATAHGEVAGAQITVYGTTNVNGTFTLDATTSVNELVVADTYVVETLTATAKAQPVLSYTPDLPDHGDNVLVYYAAREAWGIDTSRDGWQAQYQMNDQRYLYARSRLFDVGDEFPSIEASRG